MDALAVLILYTLHAMSFIWAVFNAFYRLCVPRHPQPLNASRRQLPANLGLAFVLPNERQPTEEEEESMLESVKRTVHLCRSVGIRSLSVYDRYGTLKTCAETLKCELTDELNNQFVGSGDSEPESEFEYPLSPPSSDPSSRSLSPELWEQNPPPSVTMHLKSSQKAHHAVKRRRPNQRSPSSQSFLTLSLHSYDASKKPMATVGRMLIDRLSKDDKSCSHQNARDFVTVQTVNNHLEDILNVAPPDLLIVHRLEQEFPLDGPLELDGYPPWLIRLTEFYQDSNPRPNFWQHLSKKTSRLISEESFRRALDQYASTEMRMGK